MKANTNVYVAINLYKKTNAFSYGFLSWKQMSELLKKLEIVNFYFLESF